MNSEASLFGCGPVLRSCPCLAVCILAATMCLTSCRGERPNYTVLDTGGYVLENSSDEADLRKLASMLPFDSVELARVGCDTSCPSYTIRIRRDGTASYRSEATALLVGYREAKDAFIEYGRLSQFIQERSLIERMGNTPSVQVSHAPGYELTIWPTSSEEPHVFSGPWFEGPGDAFVLRMSLDGLVAQLMWN